MITRTFKFRLYPTHSQHSKLHNTLGACRWVYNNMVSKIHKEGFQSAYDLNYFLTELKEQNPWLCEHHSRMLQAVSTQIAGAQKGLAELDKKNHKTGEIKFALFHRYNTFVYNQSGFSIKDGFLQLSKIGRIALIQHREIPQYCTIKQVTISRQAGKWFCGITFDVSEIVSIPWWDCTIPQQRPIGIDVGIKNFAYDSDGHVTPNPLNMSRMLKPLARIQRKISRRQKGSNNRNKAIMWYQRIHQRIQNRRNDFCHKTSNMYSKKHCTIYLEDLKISNMVKNHKLSRQVLDSGWGRFKTFLRYKTSVVLVSPHHTSVDCSSCGNKVLKTLAMRTHRCDACGLVLDRDHNAALNILNRGLSQHDEIVPQELRKLTPVEISKRSLKQEETTGQVQ